MFGVVSLLKKMNNGQKVIWDVLFYFLVKKSNIPHYKMLQLCVKESTICCLWH